MRYFIFFFIHICFLFCSLPILPKVLEINCLLTNQNKIETNYKQFQKGIDVDAKKILNQKNLKYDRIVSYSENELIFSNDVYETYSVFDLTTFTWTIYSNSVIDIYKCESTY